MSVVALPVPASDPDDAPLRALRPVQEAPGLEAPDDGRPLVRELEDVTGRMAAHGPLPVLRGRLTALVDAWATAMAELHARPAAETAPAPLPWVLAGPLPAWLGDLPGDVGPVWAVRAHPRVRAALDEARAHWAPTGAVHGDPTGDLVVVRHSPDGPRVTHEPARHQAATGAGDPRWDVATALDWLAIALGPALDPRWGLDPVTGFARAYRAAGGRALPSPAWAVARTLTTAVEWTAQLALAGEPDEDERAWLATLWSRPLAVAAGTAAARR